MSYLLSNAKVYIKDNLASTLAAPGTFRISVDLERSLDIETAAEEALFVLKNGTQIERFIITATAGVATIVKRGLEQDCVTENVAIQKPWGEGSIGYITMKPADLLGSGELDDDFIFNGDITFNNPVVFTESIKDPVYANAAARDAAILSPANGMSVYLTAEGYFTDYQAGAWSSRAAGAATVNADTSTAGKVEIATLAESDGGVAIGGTGASLVITPDKLAYFGDGSDGNVTISTNTTLTSDKYYNNLTVNTGVTLDPAGYIIYVAGTLTLTGTAKIIRNGNNATNAAGAVQGTGGAALATGTCGVCLGGHDGQVGGAFITNVAGIAGVATTNSYATTGTTSAAGVEGGGPTFLKGASASATQGLLYNKVLSITKLIAFFNSPQRAGSITQYTGLPSSGQSIAGASSSNAVAGASGGVGGNGGLIFIYANIIAGSGTIEAKGGNGGNGGNAVAGAGPAGGGGGGSGGQGGIIFLVYHTGTPYTCTLTGGTGGTGGAGASGGAAGTAGNSGTIGQSIVINK